MADETNDSGVGFTANVDVKLSPSGKSKDALTGEVAKSVDTALEKELTKLLDKQKALDTMLTRVATALNSASGSNNSIRKNADLKKFSQLTASFSERLKNPVNQAADPANELQATRQLLGSVVGSLKSGTKAFKGPKPNIVLDDGSKLNLSSAQSMITQTTADLNRQMLNMAKKAQEQVRLASRTVYDKKYPANKNNLPKANGMVFDFETANAQQDIWGMASYTAAGGLKSVQRDLKKDGVKLDAFNKKFVKGLTQSGGLSLGGVLEQFHSNYSKAAEATGGIKALNLPPLVGHNIQNADLPWLNKAVEEYAGQVKQGSPQEAIVKDLRRVVSKAPVADTLPMFVDFMRKDMGYAEQSGGGIGKGRGRGNSLENIAAALDIPYSGHDAAADTAATADLYRMLSTPEGRAVAKKRFSEDRWRASTTQTAIEGQIKAGLGKERIGEFVDVRDQYKAGNVAPEYSALVKEAEFAGQKTARDYFESITRGKSLTSDVSKLSPDAIKGDIKKMHSTAASGIRQEFTTKLLDFRTTNNEQSVRGNVDKILNSTGMQNLMSEVVGTYRLGKEGRVAAKAELQASLADAAMLATKGDIKATRVSAKDSAKSIAGTVTGQPSRPSRISDFNQFITGAINENVDKFANTGELKGSRVEAGSIRSTQLSSLVKGTLSEADIRSQYKKGGFMPYGPESMFERGNVFENKAIDYLKKNASDRYAITPGQQQLTLGPTTGHPDLWGVDREKNAPFLGEVKYRSKKDIDKILQTGKMPPEWAAQTNLYAMQAGLGEGALVKTFFGNVSEKDIPEVVDIDKQLQQSGLGNTRRKELEAQRTALLDARVAEMGIGDLHVMETKTDKDIMSSIANTVKSITGKDISQLKGKMPKEVSDFYAGKLGIKPEKVADAFKTAAGKYAAEAAYEPIKHSQAVAQEIMAISDGGGEVPPSPPDGGGPGGGGGGFGDLPGIPQIKVTSEQQANLLRKQLAKSTSEYGRADQMAQGYGAIARLISKEGDPTDPDKQAELAWQKEMEGVQRTRAKEALDSAKAAAKQLEYITARPEMQEPPDLSSEGFIKGQADALKQSRVAKLQEQAIRGSAGIELDGLNVQTFSDAFKSAAGLQKLGAGGTAGYDTKKLLSMARKQGVFTKEPELARSLSDGLTKGMSTDALIGKGKTVGKDVGYFKEAEASVNKLFSALQQSTGQTFLTPAAQKVQDFIKKSEQALAVADQLKVQANAERSELKRYEDAGIPVMAGQVRKQLSKTETQISAKQREAEDFARLAQTGTEGLKPDFTSVEVQKRLLDENRQAQLQSLREQDAQLQAQAQQPGFKMDRAYYDKTQAVKGELSRLQYGVTPEDKFDKAVELQLSTAEAQQKFSQFKVKLQQQSIAVKAEIATEGLNASNLKTALSSNLESLKRGLPTGTDTNTLLQEALYKDISISGKELQASKSYAKDFNMADMGIGTSDSFFTGEEKAQQTVGQLKDLLAQSLPGDTAFSQVTKELTGMEDAAVSSINKLQNMTAARDVLKSEATAAQDPTVAAKKTLEAERMSQKIAEQTVVSKQKIATFEKQAATARTRLNNPAVRQRLIASANKEQQILQRSLEMEQAKLSILVRQGTATTANMQRLYQVNNAMAGQGLSPTVSGGVSNEALFAKGRDKGVAQFDIEGGQGRRKDFISSTVGLIDWQMQWMAGMAVLGTASSAIKNSFGFAVEYEAILKGIKLVTQANVEDMRLLETEVAKLSTTFQYSAAELGDALTILGKAGFSAIESLKILPNVTALATATMSSLKVAADVSTTAVESYRLPTEDVPDLANTLAAMTVESKLDLEKLGTTFNYVAASAASAGITIEETGTAMGLMANAGIRASTIGTSLRSIMGSLMAPTAKFKKELANVGMSADEVNPITNKLSDILLKLKDRGFDVESAFSGMDKRIAGGVSTLVQSADLWAGFEGRITGTNRAFEMAAGHMDTLQAQTQRLGNAFQFFGKSIMGNNLDELKTSASVLTSILQLLTQVTDLIPDKVKSGGIATIGLTAMASISSGIFAGGKERIGSINKNKAAGKTLTGQDQMIYSTMTALFNPAVIGYAAAAAAAIGAVSEAYDIFSGKAALAAGIEVAAKLETDNKALGEAARLYNSAAVGTDKFVTAQKELRELGVTDFSFAGLDKAAKRMSILSKATSEMVAMLAVKQDNNPLTKFMDYFKNPQEMEMLNKARAARAQAALTESDLFYTGTDEEISSKLDEGGVPSEVRRSVYAARQTALQKPNAGQAILAEQRRKLDTMLDSRQIDINKLLDDQQRKVDELRARSDRIWGAAHVASATAFGAAAFFAPTVVGAGAATGAGLAIESYATMKDQEAEKAVLLLKAATQSKIDSSKENIADEQLRLNDFEALYGDNDSVTGSQRAADLKFLKAGRAVEAIKRSIGAITSLGEEGVLPQNAVDYKINSLNKELEAAKANLVNKYRTKAKRSGFEGLSSEMYSIAESVGTLTLKQDGETVIDDKEGLKLLSGIPASAMGSWVQKMEENRSARAVELSNLPEEFKTKDLVAQINLKWDLKDRTETRKIIDDANALANKYSKQLQEAISAESSAVVSDLEFNAKVSSAMLDTQLISLGNEDKLSGGKYGGYMPQGSFAGQSALEPYVSGVDENKGEIKQLEAGLQKRQAEKTASEAVFNEKKERLEQGYQATAVRLANASTLEKMKAARDYYAELNELEKSHHIKNLGYVAKEERARADLINRIAALDQKRASVAKQFAELVQEGKEKLDPARYEKTAFQRAQAGARSLSDSEQFMRAGDDAAADEARQEGLKQLRSVIQGDDASESDIRRAVKTAQSYQATTDMEFSDQRRDLEAALKPATDYLKQIRDLLSSEAPSSEERKKASEDLSNELAKRDAENKEAYGVESGIGSEKKEAKLNSVIDGTNFMKDPKTGTWTNIESAKPGAAEIAEKALNPQTGVDIDSAVQDSLSRIAGQVSDNKDLFLNSAKTSAEAQKAIAESFQEMNKQEQDRQGKNKDGTPEEKQDNKAEQERKIDVTFSVEGTGNLITVTSVKAAEIINKTLSQGLTP